MVSEQSSCESRREEPIQDPVAWRVWRDGDELAKITGQIEVHRPTGIPMGMDQRAQLAADIARSPTVGSAAYEFADSFSVDTQVKPLRMRKRDPKQFCCLVVGHLSLPRLNSVVVQSYEFLRFI